MNCDFLKSQLFVITPCATPYFTEYVGGYNTVFQSFVLRPIPFNFYTRLTKKLGIPLHSISEGCCKF